MTAHEYLSQVYYLDRQIKYDLRELDSLRELSIGITSLNLGERVKSSTSREPPFVKALERIWKQEERINSELKRLEELKEEIRNTIESQTNADERCVLLYRYIQHMKLEEIGYELNISISTVKRWYKSALSKIKVPE